MRITLRYLSRYSPTGRTVVATEPAALGQAPRRPEWFARSASRLLGLPAPSPLTVRSPGVPP